MIEIVNHQLQSIYIKDGFSNVRDIFTLAEKTSPKWLGYNCVESVRNIVNACLEDENFHGTFSFHSDTHYPQYKHHAALYHLNNKHYLIEPMTYAREIADISMGENTINLYCNELKNFSHMSALYDKQQLKVFTHKKGQKKLHFIYDVDQNKTLPDTIHTKILTDYPILKSLYMVKVEPYSRDLYSFKINTSYSNFPHVYHVYKSSTQKNFRIRNNRYHLAEMCDQTMEISTGEFMDTMKEACNLYENIYKPKNNETISIFY